MEINFIETYVPAIEELERLQVLDQRDVLSQFVTVSFPDLTTAPGTVIGDLLITPWSYIITAFELGAERILSDLCLENVANGTVYNCEFVLSYLKNLGVSVELNYPSTGVIRITFSKLSDNVGYLLDRSTLFKIGEYIYNIYLPNNGGFMCLNPDQDMGYLEGLNGSRLKQLSDDRWFCDVPVIGNYSEVDIKTSEDAAISQYIPEIVSIVTLLDFSTGTSSRTVEQLAKDTLTTIYSASLNTRGGAVQYVRSICPFVESVFAVKSGDREMLRQYDAPGTYGISTGCMDVYARSNAYEFTERLIVKLVGRPKNSANIEWFEGEWDYIGQPYHIESITQTGLDQQLLDHSILSYNTAGPGGTSLGGKVTYTDKEKLFLKVDNLTDEGKSVFKTFMEEGEQYAWFIVTYQTDPLLPAIRETVLNEDHLPINSSIVVRGFIPVIIESFLVVYVKKQGVIPDLEKATDDIKIYLASVGAPNGYSDAEIARIMGEAGVQYMKRVDVQARVLWSVADYILKYGELPNISNMWDTQVIEPVLEHPFIRDSDGLRVTYPNVGVDIKYDTMYSCSPRNIRYYVLENAIKFKEVVDV